MGIKAILESMDELPDALKEFYKEDGDNFVLDIDGIDSHPKVRGVITANSANKQTRDKLRVELEDFKKKYSWLPEDFDADAMESLKQAAEGKGGQPTEEQISELRSKIAEKLEKKYQPEIASRDEKLGKLNGAIQRMTIDEGLAKAADAAHIDPDFKDAAIALILRSAKISVEEDGEAYKAQIETDMGPVSIGEYVRDWVGTDQGKKFLAKSTGPDTKGSRGGGGSKTMKRGDFETLDHSARRSAIADGVKVVD